MPKWISVEAAAAKYGFNKEVILLWAEMKRFSVGYGEPSPVIDERSFQEFLCRMKKGITSEYIDTLEELCMQKTRICDLYVEIIGDQDKELLRQREKIAKIDQIQAAMKMQNDRIKDCKKVFAEYGDTFRDGWAEKLHRSLKRLLANRKSWKS